MLTPLKFRAIIKQALWSGQDIVQLKQLEDYDCVGESWEISAFAGDETPVVGNAEHEGWTLRQLCECYQAAFVGRKNWERFGADFPMLIKFLSSASDLSIQVHPDDAMAQNLDGYPYGKSEMWYVVSARKGAQLVAGFTQDLTPETYEQLLQSGRLTEVLARYEVKAGDVFSIPAGQIHSIGAGNFIIEVQQTSDTTYRVYDFDRRDAEGRKRELHSEKARRALDFSARCCKKKDYESPPNQRIALEENEHFTVNLFHVDPTSLPQTELCVAYEEIDSFVAHVIFEGAAWVCDQMGNRFLLRAGETLLYPATTQWVKIQPIDKGRFSFIETYII